MKKTLFVAALAAVLVFAFAASALADIGSPNDFEAWATSVTNGTTPHMGFTASTVKCAVCHSVHNADVPVGAANQNILLATDSASACTYCHITGGVSSKEPYGTDPLYYTVDNAFNHSDGSVALSWYAGCTSCHAVHGAGTITGNVGSSILVNHTAYRDAQVPGTYVTGTRVQQLTAFCAQCHQYFEAGYDTMTPGTLGDHVMTSDAADYNNHEASLAVQGKQVAFTASTYCTSCHDTEALAAFPHYTGGYARFMYGGANTGSVTNTLANPSMDGACLKCHANANGISGVNMSF